MPLLFILAAALVQSSSCEASWWHDIEPSSLATSAIALLQKQAQPRSAAPAVAAYDFEDAAPAPSRAPESEVTEESRRLTATRQQLQQELKKELASLQSQSQSVPSTQRPTPSSRQAPSAKRTAALLDEALKMQKALQEEAKQLHVQQQKTSKPRHTQRRAAAALPEDPLSLLKDPSELLSALQGVASSDSPQQEQQQQEQRQQQQERHQQEQRQQQERQQQEQQEQRHQQQQQRQQPEEQQPRRRSRRNPEEDLPPVESLTLGDDVAAADDSAGPETESALATAQARARVRRHAASLMESRARNVKETLSDRELDQLAEAGSRRQAHEREEKERELQVELAEELAQAEAARGQLAGSQHKASVNSLVSKTLDELDDEQQQLEAIEEKVKGALAKKAEGSGERQDAALLETSPDVVATKASLEADEPISAEHPLAPEADESMLNRSFRNFLQVVHQIPFLGGRASKANDEAASAAVFELQTLPKHGEKDKMSQTIVDEMKKLEGELVQLKQGHHGGQPSELAAVTEARMPVQPVPLQPSSQQLAQLQQSQQLQQLEQQQQRQQQQQFQRPQL